MLTVLLVGFTPTTVPDAVPAEMAGPVEEVAESSAAFVGSVLQSMATQGEATTSSQDGAQNGTATTTRAADSGSSSQIDRVELERLVHQAVNKRRGARDLSYLVFDDGRREIARYHSGDMAQRDYFAHTGPDGETVEDRYEQFGYECRVPMGDGRYATGGENIFMTTYSGYTYKEAELANRTVEGWMNSPGHRENLLREYWQSEGIGVYVTESYGETTVYVTQNFC